MSLRNRRKPYFMKKLGKLNWRETLRGFFMAHKLNNQKGHGNGQESLLAECKGFSYTLKRAFQKRAKDPLAILSLCAILAMAGFTGSVFRYEKEEAKRQADYLAATKGYSVYYEGKFVGNIREKEQMDKAMAGLQKELSSRYGAKAILSEDIRLEETHFEAPYETSYAFLYAQLRKNVSVEVEAIGIYINGKEILRVHDGKEAKALLEAMKTQSVSVSEGDEVLSSTFVEAVNLKPIPSPISQIVDLETALTILETGTDEMKTHVVEKGEVTSIIAKEYNLSLEDIQKANPEMNLAKIFPGDELNLVVPKPYLTVKTVVKKSYTEKNMPYEKIYKESGAYYKDEEFVSVKGENGVSQLVCEVSYVNGLEESRNILSETVVSAPKEAIIIKGTKEIPALKGTGRFAMPVRGTLSSPFGKRGRGFHTGIDLANKVGTPIKAADGGVVTFAGYKGNYGYMVDIDHGGGFVTRYAHCSALYVKKGDKVYKDKTIAAIGLTGRTSGPHLHFEVRKYGTPKNPYTYLGKTYR